MAASAPSSIRKMQERLGDPVRNAYILATAAHAGQKRKSGEKYISHPLAVAEMLFLAGADADTVCAALLHDAFEQGANRERIERDIHALLGDRVLFLVHAVSKDGRIADKGKQQSAYMEQIANAFQVDISAFFIKVADLIHNLRTVASLPGKTRGKWILELKYDYLPLLSEYFHRIPSHEREMYHSLLDDLLDVLAAHDRKAASLA